GRRIRPIERGCAGIVEGQPPALTRGATSSSGDLFPEVKFDSFGLLQQNGPFRSEPHFGGEGELASRPTCTRTQNADRGDRMLAQPHEVVEVGVNSGSPAARSSNAASSSMVSASIRLTGALLKVTHQ